MNIDLQAAAGLLRARDNIVILAHRKPDGDTYGSCFGLLYALEELGKTARVECADGYSDRYAFLYEDYVPRSFTPAFVVSADVASAELLGEKAAEYPKVDLCIDHHKSNTLYAAQTLLDASAAATAQIVYKLILELGVKPDRQAANALFTGISTDTGCFRFSNVDAATHRIAADLIELGAEHHRINKLMFDTKSRGRLDVEKLMMETLSFYFDGRCAIVTLPADIMERFGVTEEDLDGISSFPRRIEHVLVGVTVRTNADGSYRVSMRADAPADASRICSSLGGGGHTGAAGCTLTGEPGEIHSRLLEAVRQEFRRLDLC